MRFVLKTSIRKSLVRFDLKTECPRGCKWPVLQNKRVLSTKAKQLHHYFVEGTLTHNPALGCFGGQEERLLKYRAFQLKAGRPCTAWPRSHKITQGSHAHVSKRPLCPNQSLHSRLLVWGATCLGSHQLLWPSLAAWTSTMTNSTAHTCNIAAAQE